MPISSVAPYQFLIDAWRVKRAEMALAEKQAAVDEVERSVEMEKARKAHEDQQKAAFDAAAAAQAASEVGRIATDGKARQLEAQHVALIERLAAAEQALKELKGDAS